MSKKYDEIKNLFDDVEQSSSENPVEDGTQQNEMSPSSGSSCDDGLEFIFVTGADCGQKFGFHSRFYYQPPFSWWFSYGQIK